MKKEKLVHRLIKKLSATRLISGWMSQILHRVDRLTMRLTGGRLALSSLLTGIPYIELVTTGAKSGLERISPLFSLIDKDKFILIASSLGRKNNPGWYYNLISMPTAVVIYKGKKRKYIAREAEGKEREKYWQQAVQIYEGYQNYAQWAKHRKIPVMILEPTLK